MKSPDTYQNLKTRTLSEFRFEDRLEVPICTLDAVSKQSHKIFVSHTANRFNLHLKLPLGLTPDN